MIELSDGVLEEDSPDSFDITDICSLDYSHKVLRDLAVPHHDHILHSMFFLQLGD